MMRMNLQFCFWLVLALQTTSGASTKGVDEHVHAIIDWIETKGGMFHEKLQVRRYDPDDPASPAGLYVTGNIRQGETLMSIPRETLISGKGNASQYNAELWYPTAFALIRELRLGDESTYAPYVNYLLAQPRGQLPSTWS